jgi:hypothetical protein
MYKSKCSTWRFTTSESIVAPILLSNINLFSVVTKVLPSKHSNALFTGEYIHFRVIVDTINDAVMIGAIFV